MTLWENVSSGWSVASAALLASILGFASSCGGGSGAGTRTSTASAKTATRTPPPQVRINAPDMVSITTYDVATFFYDRRALYYVTADGRQVVALDLANPAQERWRVRVPFAGPLVVRELDDAGKRTLVVASYRHEMLIDPRTGTAAAPGPRTWRGNWRAHQRDGVCYQSSSCSLSLIDCATDKYLGFFRGVEYHVYLRGNGEHDNICAVRPAPIGRYHDLILLFDVDRGGKSLGVSPNGRVFVHGFGGSTNAGRLVAVDARTGKARWRSPLIPVGFSGTPPAMGVHSHTGICWVVTNHLAGAGFDCRSGKLRWQAAPLIATKANGKRVRGWGQTHRLDDARLLVATGEHRAAQLDLTTGIWRWQRTLAPGEAPVFREWAPYAAKVKRYVILDSATGQVRGDLPAVKRSSLFVAPDINGFGQLHKGRVSYYGADGRAVPAPARTRAPYETKSSPGTITFRERKSGAVLASVDNYGAVWGTHDTQAGTRHRRHHVLYAAKHRRLHIVSVTWRVAASVPRSPGIPLPK